MSRRGDRAKHVVDVVVVGAVLVLSLPVQAVVAGAIRRSLRSTVLFRQHRPGKDGVVVELLKFLTMSHADAQHATDAERLTSRGRFLRSTSLDDLATFGTS